CIWLSVNVQFKYLQNPLPLEFREPCAAFENITDDTINCCFCNLFAFFVYVGLLRLMKIEDIYQSLSIHDGASSVQRDTEE
ncbi:hypothetical protein STEG23_017577, partial [Scotinomys teguina]